MDSYSQEFMGMQMAMSNQIGDLQGTARNQYASKVNKVYQEFNKKKSDLMAGYEYLKNKKEAVDTSIKDLGGSIEASTLGRKLFGDSIEKLKAKIAEKKANIADKIDEVKGKVESKVGDIESKVKDVKSQVSDKADELTQKGETMQENINSKIGNAKDKFNDVKSNIESKVDEAQSKVGDIQESAESKIGDIQSKVGDIQESAESKLSEPGDIFSSSSKPQFTQEIEMQDLSLPEDDVLGTPFKFGKLPPSLNPSQTSSLNAPAEALEQQAESKFSQMKSFVGRTIGNVKNKVQDIKGAIQSKFAQAKSTAEDVGDTAKSQISDLQDTASNVATKAAETTAENVGEDVAEGVGEVAGETGAEVAGELGVGALFGPIGEGVALVAGIGTAIYGAVSTAVDVANDIANPTKGLDNQENKKLKRLNPNVDLTGKFVSPNSVSIYNEQTHFNGF